MNAKASNLQISTESFSLQRRKLGGGTEALSSWGAANETDPLTDVLLGSPEALRHLATSSLSKKYLRENPSNLEIAKKQHAFFKQTPVYDNKLVPYTNVEFGEEKRFL